MSKATPRAVTRTVRDDALRTNVRSRIAYRAEDGNTWRGPWRGSFADAARDAREHNAERLVPPAG